MIVYIASSWKNRLAVELLTERLRERGHHVLSFVEHEGQRGVNAPGTFEEWIDSPDGRACFDFDTTGATGSDLVVYVGPSGCDAWAEIGAAWAVSANIVGIWAKGEQVGLMRRLIRTWFDDHRTFFEWFDKWAAMCAAARGCDSPADLTGSPANKETAK